MDRNKIDFANLVSDAKKNAIKANRKCFYPNCNKPTINSHILQRNGILSQIAPDRHLWKFSINFYKEPFIQFERKGINDIFTFYGFCGEDYENHDKKLFQKIEDNRIDFKDYESCLLLCLRTLYNEIWLKKVAIEQTTNIVKQLEDEREKAKLNRNIEGNKLGLKDFKYFEDKIWNDINNNTQSFVFNYREFDLKEICLSSILTYETTYEINYIENLTRQDVDRYTDFFLQLFPYNGKSILLVGYLKEDESKIKPYINTFFKENDKKTLRKLTNYILFYAETWVCSDDFYDKKIKNNEHLFFESYKFAQKYNNERRIFDINIFDDKFSNKFREFISKIK